MTKAQLAAESQYRRRGRVDPGLVQQAMQDRLKQLQDSERACTR
jgi:hypothetical protein